MTVSREVSAGLWTFDGEPDALFEVPSVDSLAARWQASHTSDRVEAMHDDFYGVFETTDQPPTAFISLDLCEVVRQTGYSLQMLQYSDHASLASQDTFNTLSYNDFYSSWQRLDPISQDFNRLALQQLMHQEQVPPVPFAEAIQAFLQRWKDAGVYTIANTSTLPGCENSTIDFLAHHYPDSVRGILLPRNHDGQGSVTKSSILRSFKQQFSVSTQTEAMEIPTLAIEDGEHHARVFSEQDPDMPVFMPAYFWNTQFEDTPSITRVKQGLGTVDTFVAVDQYLQSRGIV